MGDFWSDVYARVAARQAAPTSENTERDSGLGRVVRANELATTRKEAFDRNQGGVSRELESGWEQTKGAVARTVGEFTGWDAAKDYADQRAAEAEGLSASSGFTQSLDDVEGVGSLASYAAKATLNTIPAVASMALPGGAVGLGARAAGAGLNAARAAGAATAFGSNVLQQTGSNLDAQIDEGEETDLIAAGAAGVAQGALDTFTGVGGRALGAVGLGRKATEVAGKTLLGRTARKAGRTAAEEFVTEGAQQVLQEGARSTVTDPGAEFDMAAAGKRVVDAAITGGLVGGLVGGALPTGRRRDPVPSADPVTAGDTPAGIAGDARVDPLNMSRESQRADKDIVQPDVTNMAAGERVLKLAGPEPAPTITPPTPDRKPQQDVLDLFTGATPESLRPVSEGDLVRAVRGPLALDKNVRSITETLIPILNGGKPRGKNRPGIPVTERAATAYAALDALADKFAASPSIPAEMQESYLGALARAAELVQAYELNLESLGAPRAATAPGGPTVQQMAGPGVPIVGRVNAAQVGFDSTVRPGEDIGQLTVDANIAQQQAAAQAQAEQQRSIELGMVEQAQAQQEQAEQLALSVEEQQARQAEDNARIAKEQMLPAQRQELLNSIVNGPKPDLTPLRSFMQGLLKLDPQAQPTPEELATLAQYTSMSYPEKVAKAETIAPKLVPKAPQNEGMLEPVTVKGKTNKRQLRAQQARAEATARVPEDQQPPELKSMLKALEDTAASIDTIFKSLLDAAPVAQAEQLSLFQGDDPRIQPGQRKGFQQIVQNRIGPQDAKFQKQLAEVQAAVAKLEADQKAAVAPKQEALFTAKGQPTKAALRLTPDQLVAKIRDTQKKMTGALAPRTMILSRLEELVGTVAPEKISLAVDSLANPDVSIAETVQAFEFSAPEVRTPAPAPAVEPEVTTPAEPDNAAFQEPDAEPEPPLFRQGAQPEARPMTVSQIEAEVARLTRNWKNPPRIQIMNPVDPTTWPEGIDPTIDKPFGLYMPTTAPGGAGGVVYLYGPQMQSPADVRATLYHEALGHYGLRERFGEHLQSHLRAIWNSSPALRAEALAWQRAFPAAVRNVKAAGWDPNIYALEEVIVSKGENRDISTMSEPTATLFERLAGFLSRTLAKFGLYMPNPMAKYDAFLFLRQAHYAVTRGPVGPKPGRAAPGMYFARQAPPSSSSPSLLAGSPEVLQSRSMNLRRALAARGVPDTFINLAVVAQDQARNITLGTLLGRNLVARAEQLGLGSAKRLFDIQQAVMAKTNEYVKTLDQLVVDAMNLDSKGSAFLGRTPERDALNAYMKKATLNGKWGYQPTWKTEQVQIDPVAQRMTDEFRAKHPAAFAVADQMFEYSDRARNDLQAAVTQYIEQETAGDLANALTPAERKSIEDRKARELKLFDKLVPKLEGPYAPLSRFGQYAAIAKSARFVELEKKVKDKTADKDEVAELGNLRTDPNHYAVFFRDSQADADTVLLEKLQSNPAFKGGQLYSSVRNEVFEQIGESPIMQMQRFKDMMVKELGETDRLGRKTTREIENMIKDLYIRTLAETSARQHDQYREGIDGADDNMLRSFAQKGRADAHILAQITDRYEIGQVMQTMISQESTVRDEQYAERKRVLREILMRHKQEMIQEETPVQDKLMAISSLYHLATSPRYYLMNSLQPWMVSAPYLAGKHGIKAYSTLYDAYKAIAPQMKSAEFWKGKVDLDKLAGITGAERAALKQMQLTGLLELGQQYDQGYFEASDGALRAVSEATHVFRTLSGQVEYINRVSSALAAYRLSGGKVDAMSDILAKTQFDYSNRNQPRYFNALPKVVTQFRKYQLGQLALWLGMIKDAKTSPDARRALAYMTGQLGLVTGAVGLPAAQLLGVVGSAIFKEDDEPLDGEKWLTDLVGGGVAARGIPSLLGVELANGLGLGTLVNPFPFLNYSELDSRDGVRDATFAILGPSMGLVDKAQRGVEALQQGEYLRALGESLPSGVTNGLRAYELATRGFEKKNGDMLLSPDEIGEVNVMLQALGFSPSIKLDAQRINRQKIEYEEHFKQRASALKRAYIQAQESNDADAQREVVVRWDALQATKEQYGFKKTSKSELLRARAEKRKRERDTVGGVQVRDSNRRFVEQELEN
jgi:hypothetical protein